jgi:dipeptidyl aminopeptidase/acylaminoacyl peptidase
MALPDLARRLAQRRGIPSELLYFPNENHIISSPAATIRWYEVVDAWLDRWTAP